MVKKLTQEHCVRAAKKRNGKCLSEYKNARAQMNWQCSEDHIWSTTLDQVKNGNTWCPTCYGNTKLTIRDCQKIAKDRSGKCLSATYTNSNTPMEWECEEGHRWMASFRSVKQAQAQSWCIHCYYNTKKLLLEECQHVAAERGGKCLEKEYINVRAQMKWQCSEGHIWSTKFTSVKHSKKWCPYCAKGRSENLSRDIIEELMGLPFPSVWPDFLSGLELDGYNEDLQLAFEYQGKQHYQHVPYFHKDITQFYAQQERDQRKYKICQEKGITLILIPYKFSYQNEPELRQYIYEQLIVTGYIFELKV